MVKRKRIDWPKHAFIALMLAWAIIHFCVFWVYVNANSFVLTFFKFDTETAQYEWYGLTRFENIFKDMILGRDPLVVQNLKNSLWCFPVQNFIILPLSFFSAYFLFKKVPFSNLFRVIFFIPSMLSVVVLAMSFKFMWNADFGPISNFLKNAFGLDVDWFSSMSPTAMPLVFTFGVWAGLGYDIVLLNGAISRLPQEVIEAGKLDGVGVVREMFQIILPLVMPTHRNDPVRAPLMPPLGTDIVPCSMRPSCWTLGAIPKNHFPSHLWEPDIADDYVHSPSYRLCFLATNFRFNVFSERDEHQSLSCVSALPIGRLQKYLLC